MILRLSPGRFALTLGLLGTLIVTACARPPQPAAEPSYSGTNLSGPAPDFELVNHRGETFRLSAARGKVVVLAFLDPNCTDICPLTAQHFRRAVKALGENDHVLFVAVNVNDRATSQSDILRATARWNLGDIESWHFLTGRAKDLQAVRDAYDMFAAEAKPDRPGEVAHSPGVYVIGPGGDRRWFISTAFDPSLPLSELIVARVRELISAGS